MKDHRIPSVKKLRLISQEAKSHRTEWQYIIHRKLSIYLTWLLLHTGLTANQVTIISICSGFLGALSLLFAPGPWSLSGYLLFYGYFLLDKVDGEIARFKKEESLRGIFLDYMGHMIVPPLLPLSVGGYLAERFAISEFWLLGALAALSCMFVRGGRDIALSLIFRKHSQLESEVDRLLANETISQSPPDTDRHVFWFYITTIFDFLDFLSCFWVTVFLLLCLQVVYLLYNPFGIFLLSGFSFLCLYQIIRSAGMFLSSFWNAEKKISFFLRGIINNVPLKTKHGETLKTKKE